MKKLGLDLVVQRFPSTNESSPRALSNGHGFRDPCFQGVPDLGGLVHPLPAVWTVFDGFHETVKREGSDFVFSGSNNWAAQSIRFQQFGPFLTVFMKRLNENVQVSFFRAENDTK